MKMKEQKPTWSFYSILKISILIFIKAALREMFDCLDANKSGELYTAEAVDGLRKLDDNNQIPFNLTWREVKMGVS